MTHAANSGYVKLFRSIVTFATRHALPLVVAATILVGGTLQFAANNLSINTDTVDMIDDGLEFRQHYEAFRQNFPFGVDNMLLVIDAPSPEAANQAAEIIAARLSEMPEIIETVHRPGAGDYFARNALMFLDERELTEFANGIATMQPFMGRLSRDPSIITLADTLSAALTEGGPVSQDALDKALAEFAETLERPAHALSWQRLLNPARDGTGDARRYIEVKPALDFALLMPAEDAMRALHAIANELELEGHGVKLRVTGEAALAHEELISAMQGAQRAGIAALIMVSVVLMVGLGSIWLVAASLLTLLTGLTLTAGFAAFAIGHLNLISIAFAVLYIGLGIDYAIHFCLRYRDQRSLTDNRAAALQACGGLIGRTLLICTFTTATAFLAFVPTTFSGVAELGLISAAGMVINLVLSLTLLPALLMLLPAPRAQRHAVRSDWSTRLMTLPQRHARVVMTLAILAAIGATALLPQVSFDRNTLNLRDPDSESVSTARELMTGADAAPIGINFSLNDTDAVADVTAKLEALDTVAQVTSLDTFIPLTTDRKLELLDELLIIAGDMTPMSSQEAPIDMAATLGALKNLADKLRRTSEPGPTQLRLARALDSFLQQLAGLDANTRQQRATDLTTRTYRNLPAALEQFDSALDPDPEPASTLPAELRDRWINEDGDMRFSVLPAQAIDANNAALRRFVDTVQTIVPDATGEATLSLRAGDAVVRAFIQAFATAFAAILLILLVLLRSARATALVMMPLLLAALLTLGGMVLTGTSLNFANVIALPLLLGIGVDNGIHMVQRMRETKMTETPSNSTTRAILFSSLTTLCSFGNLLASPHPGTASMGLLLTLGVGMTLLATLCVLPAALHSSYSQLQN